MIRAAMEPSQAVAGLADCNPAQDCGNSVLDKLRAREAQRTADAARRLEALHGSADPQESVEAFLERYGAERCELTAAVQAATSGADATAAREGLDALTARVAALEGDVAKASYFLPPYDLRQATLGVTALKEQVEAAVAALQPRKKFSFRNKVSAAVAVAAASAPAAVPASVAEAAPSGKASFSAGCAIRGLRGQSILLHGGEVAGQDYTLSDLEDCTICLLGPLAALFMHGLRRCHVVAGPVAGATFMEGNITRIAPHCILSAFWLQRASSLAACNSLIIT